MTLTRDLLLPIVLLLALGAPAQAKVQIQTYDAIAAPGGTVELGAKFERSFGLGALYRPDLERKSVELSYAGRSWSLRTDDEGVARTSIQAPTQPGTYPFGAKYKKNAAAGTLWVIDRPIAIVDIDGTISDLPNDLLIPFKGATAKTFPGSPELLRDLARTHQIVYLTARDDTWNPQTRAFLALHNFPAGPVIYNERGQKAHGEYKLAELRALRARGLRLALGIGNAETDAYAYETAGIPSYIRTDQVASGTSFRFRHTDDLRRRLVLDGHLSVGLAGSVP